MIPAALNVASRPSPVIRLTPTIRPATPPLADEPVAGPIVPVVAGALSGGALAASGALAGDVAGNVAIVKLLIAPSGTGSHVTMVEVAGDPLSKLALNRLTNPLVRARNVESLRRLQRICETGVLKT